MSIAFERAKKSFLAFLTKQAKATNTIKNYVCDLDDFGTFCDENRIGFPHLSLKELEAYAAHLEARGLRVNSRRRKMMTAKAFLRHLAGKLDLNISVADRFIPPEKVEKLPRLVSKDVILKIAADQPPTALGRRNRALILVLVDTGILVTEAVSIRRDDVAFFAKNTGATIEIRGSRARSLRVAREAARALFELEKSLSEIGDVKKRPLLFYGYSKAGPNPDRLTPRGVELLFKGWAKKFDVPHLHPRTLRHICVIEAMLAGTPESEIMNKLALRTPYAFRIYRELFKKVSRHTKSNALATYSEPIDLPEQVAPRE